MILTNAIRKDIAIGLTRKAIAKHGPDVSVAFQKLNDDFWMAHEANVAKLINLPRTKWAELIQAGMIQTTIGVSPQVKHDGKNASHVWIHHNVRGKKDTHIEPFILVVCAPEFKAVDKLTASDYYSQYHHLKLANDISVPSLNGMSVLDGNSQLYADARRCYAMLKQVIDAASNIYDQTMSVLLSIKTDKQLLDILPEAKEFLSEPEPKEAKAVMPVEYVNQLRDRIKSGVPDQLAAA